VVTKTKLPKENYKADFNPLARFSVVNNITVEFVSNGAKVSVSGDTPDESWVTLDLVVKSCEELKDVIQEAYNLRKV
jgi:hypothetical protein